MKAVLRLWTILLCWSILSVPAAVAVPTGCCVLETPVDPRQACNFLISCVCKQQVRPFQEIVHWGNVVARNAVVRKFTGAQNPGDCTHPSYWVPAGAEPCGKMCQDFTCPFTYDCRGTYWTWESCQPPEFVLICTTGVPQDICLERLYCHPGDCPYLLPKP